MQGQPPEMAGSTLAPIAPHLTGRPASELPLDKLKVPKGFKVEVWADGVQVAANQNGVTGPNGLAINSGRYPGEVSDCQVAEILVYSRALSGDERSQIESYLRSKWGVGR